jgi:hypothetical protein
VSALAALQATFLQTVIEGNELAAGDIRETPQFNANQRLAVYANAYRRRLVEALASVFERAHAVLGEDDFDALASAYVEAHAPTDRALRWYGTDFPQWLRSQGQHLEHAADVALIDGALRRAFDAADATPIERDALLALSPEQWASLRFQWAPALSIDTVDPAAIALWRDQSALPTDSDRATHQQVPVAFWRRDGQTFFRSLAPAEGLLMARLRDGQSLAEACLSEDNALPMEVAVPALVQWVDDTWIAGLVCTPLPGTDE